MNNPDRVELLRKAFETHQAMLREVRSYNEPFPDLARKLEELILYVAEDLQLEVHLANAQRVTAGMRGSR